MFFIYGCHLLNKLVNDLFMKACGTYLLNNLVKMKVFSIKGPGHGKVSV